MSTLKIYNSLTKSKVETKFTKEVNMYTCGVTVYDECHIGHARSLYIFEVIRKYLKHRGFKVKFVRNITDIDDKIINRANELGVSWKDLTNKYIAKYYEDLKVLGIDQADKEPRATESIKDMVTYIKELIDKGYAYVTESGVYFSVRKFKDYGKLSGQSIDQMREGSRVAKDEAKEDPLDFALWKKAKEGEPSWLSPWGKGRPGWHIECSVMSQKFLKTETLDIHGGGRDLIFPHHENESAQAQSLTGKVFANYWIHHGLLTINSQKMSKSLGNFVTIQDAVQKYSADILKVFYLQAHYSSSIDYSGERMEEARKAYERIIILKDKLEKDYKMVLLDKKFQEATEFITPFKEQFIEAMDDDFNMPKALAVLFDLVNACNKTIDSKIEFKEVKLKYALETIKEIANVFCLDFFREELSEILEKDINKLIKMRSECKQQKKYQDADDIRKKLKERGIILEDKRDGSTSWRREI